VTVLGTAGIGKSRLVTELLTEVRPRAAVLATRCPPYGDGITFWPLVQLLRATGGEEALAAAVREAAAEAEREGRAALIVPTSLLPRLPQQAESSFDELAPPFQTLTPRAAKGLEFDRVVLLEPAAIAGEGERIEGLRALYVALTRATQTLTIVHARPLPEELVA
jgi:superfamily I DNA/RNA helicase